MNSRERVMTVFEHEQPDRVPAWCGASVEFWEKAKRELGVDDERIRVNFGDDFRRVFASYDLPDIPLSEGTTYRTVFGIERHGIGYGMPTSHPLANATIGDVHDYPWPDPQCVHVENIRSEAEAYNQQYAILGGDWSPFWHDAIDLLGMENLYYKMNDEPELVDAVFQHLTDFYAASNQRILDEAADVVDILFIGNDFGSQNGPLLSVEWFNRFLKPHLKRLTDIGHAYGLKVMLHCCGGFAPLIPSMIDIGFDGLHTIQPSCKGMDLKTLKSEFGDRIILNGAIDSQRTLIEGSPESVRNDTRETLEIMMPGGGYIAGASHDTILEETPVENVAAMFDAIREFGVYG